MWLKAMKRGLKYMNNLTKLNLDNYKPLRDVVFENLRTAILDGKFKSRPKTYGSTIGRTIRGK